MRVMDSSPSSDFNPALSLNPLLTMQAINVLREELEYFSIPPKDCSAMMDESGFTNEPLISTMREIPRGEAKCIHCSTAECE
jgi:hypothetical protein